MHSQQLSVVFLILIALVKAQSNLYLVPRVEDVQTRQDDGQGYRLPNDTKPESYDITLSTRVDIQNFTFEGKVKIGITVVEATSTIKIHHRQLTILSVTLWTVGVPPEVVDLNTYTYDQDVEHLIIPLANGQLPQNTSYVLEIDYMGTLRQDNGGFYRSRYLNKDGVEVWLATTQFSPTNARHAFPCYDEPYFKASYAIRIIHGTTYKALSNMEFREGYPIINGDGTTTTEFNPTPLVSSYLVGFIVSDFISLENPHQGKIPHRVFARANAISQSYFILDTGVKLLDAIGDYLGVDYPLPKMDQVAIPDFYFNAMENWGLTTYRERQFFYDEAVTEYFQKTNIVTVISHEFAHNWFGNLCTPRWWSYLWLKEGFANLFQFVGTDLIYPEWRILDFYVVNTLQNVFLSDELESTRPMTYYAESAEAVLALFDNIAYAKSGCVLRMFMNALTKPTFVKGLNNYLNARSYSSASEDDLFDAVETAILENNQILPTSFDIIMSSWTRQSGFPVLNVERDYQTSTILLSQERSLRNSSNTADLSTWWIPYNYVTESSGNFTDTAATNWLPQGVRSQNITVPNLSENEWIIFNAQQTGYYRVKYDELNYEFISDALFGNITLVHAVSRAQLIDDAFNFARRDELRFDVFLYLIRFLESDNDYIPWAAADISLSYLDRMFSGHTNHIIFRDFIRKLTTFLYESVGIDDLPIEPHLRKYARTLALKWACTSGSHICHDDTLRRLRLLRSDVEFHQNVRPEMYCGALRTSTKSDFEYVWARLLRSNDAAYRRMLITALGCTTSIELLTTFLSTSLASTNPLSNVTYQPNEVVNVFNSVYQSGREGLELAIDFLTININEAFNTYGNSSLRSIITGMANLITNHEQHQQFNILANVIKSGIHPNETLNAIENTNNVILSNIAWLEKYGSVIDEWLREHNESENGSSKIFVPVFSVIATIILTIVQYW